MISEQSVRKRIADVIMHGVEDENEWVDDPGEARTEAIIAIVREALLSEASTLAAIDSLGNEFIGVPGDVEEMLSVVFDTAFGADDDRGER